MDEIALYIIHFKATLKSETPSKEPAGCEPVSLHRSIFMSFFINTSEERGFFNRLLTELSDIVAVVLNLS